MVSKFFKNWKKYSRHFTLHGFGYFSESKSLAEMIFWVIVLSFCFGMCCWLMAIHLLRFESKPTVTTIRTTAYPISNIVFPAITVCNSNTVFRQNTQNLYKQLLQEGIDEDTIDDFFKDLRYLMSPAFISVEKYEDIYSVLEQLEYTPDSLMKSLAHPCEEMMRDCKWSGVTYNCSAMFRLMKTGLGYCCIYDSHQNLKNREPEHDVILEDNHQMGAGSAQGLMITVDINPYEYISKIYPFYAVIVMVHHSLDYPDTSTFSTAVQPGDFTLLQITPTVFNADNNLKDVKVEKRGCWLNDEGQLISNSEYSFKNCIIECKTKAIADLCGCVPFYYPVLGDYRQCTLLDVACLKKNELTYNKFNLAELSKNRNEDNANESTICNCLPECSDISFDGYINTAKDAMQNKYATVQIFFQQSWCVEYFTNLNMTWDMLLASLGGIFGLCLGGSLISVIELIYYFLLSIYDTVKAPKIQDSKKISILPIMTLQIESFQPSIRESLH